MTTMSTGGLPAGVKLQLPEPFDRTMDIKVLKLFFVTGMILYFDGFGG